MLTISKCYIAIYCCTWNEDLRSHFAAECTRGSYKGTTPVACKEWPGFAPVADGCNSGFSPDGLSLRIIYPWIGWLKWFIIDETSIRDPVICRTSWISWLQWATMLQSCIAGICTYWRLDFWFCPDLEFSCWVPMSSLVIWTEHKDDFSQAPCVETGVDQALLYLRMVDMPAHFSVGCVMIDDDRL